VSFDELRALYPSWPILAACCGLLFGIVRLYQVRHGQPLLPPQRWRAVPWTGLQVLFVSLVVLLFWPVYLDSVLSRVGFFEWVYGPGFPAGPPGADATPVEQAAWDMARHQHGAWAAAVAWPLQVATIVVVLHWLSGARSFQFGLTTHRLAGDLGLGCLAWLAVIPVVYVVALVSENSYERWAGAPPKPHPLTELLANNPGPLEWARDTFLALIAAPVLEELLFRGVLQRWMNNRARAAWIGVGAALAVAAAEAPTDPWWLRLGPPVFILLLVPPFVLLGRLRRRRRQTWQGIYASALLFAAAHSGVWPTPIPLFVLGLALGWLAWRTQSLTAPIVLHVLFNGLTILTFALG
jgi:membrane protease YdiL (CAAX protease family)